MISKIIISIAVLIILIYILSVNMIYFYRFQNKLETNLKEYENGKLKGSKKHDQKNTN